MNREQMNAPFAEEELQTFQGRGGKTMTYIEDETVMDRLDVGYGPGRWQIQVEAVNENVVKVRLGVLEDREWVWYEDFGYPNNTDGETLKQAVSDGIRRCGRYVGIARDLYRKSTYERPDGHKPSSEPAAARNGHGVREAAPNGGLIGKAEVGKGDADAELRQGPDGMVLCFRLTSKDGGIKVIATDPLASSLALVKETFLGQRVTCWGRVSDEAYTANKVKPNERTQTYQVLRLTKLQTSEWTMPPDAEAPPLFDENEQARIDAALAAV